MNPNRGQLAVRTIKALGVARGDFTSARAYAQSQNWLNANEVVASLKAAVTALGTDDFPLPTAAAFDFAEFIRPLTILGKLAGLRRVPARVRLISATSGSTAYWAGERAPRPVSSVDLSGDTLELLSVIAMLVTTRELLRSSAPSAESALSRDLSAAAAAAMDVAFIDPDNAGIAGVRAASITNGVTPHPSSGSTLAQIDADLQFMIGALSLAGSDLQFAAFVMRPRTATYLAGLRGTGGAPAFPQMGAKGGVLLGLPAITSAHVPVEIGSPGDGETSITLLDAAQILVADDGDGALEVSDQTALQMESEPGTDVASMVSLYQTESAALKITRHANWRVVRAGMVQVLSAVGF